MFRRAVLLLALLGCQGKGQHAAGDRAFEDVSIVAGATLEGAHYDIANDRGSPVLLNVWATWCGPCREELPELARVHQAYGPRGLRVVGINVDAPKHYERARNMLRAAGVKYPQVLDAQNASMGPLKVEGYPTTLLVGRDGQVRWRRDGLVEPNDERLAAAIESALKSASKAVAAP